ncbi:MAG TPA: ABC transporter permease [Candidatus Sulfotelmatobacter sp.]|nr:ABC transporter permease [Candidatus Sulfotelmatobacter sp.]
MGTVGQEIRYALRNLGKSPGFAIVAVVTLALGIGASTAIFSVVDNILMEPFPYPDAQRFMSIRIHDTEKNQPGGRARFPGPEYLEYAEQNHVFDRVIAAVDTDVLYRSGEGSLRFHGAYVTPGTFEFLGMPALLGRVMLPADYEPGAPPVFMLRYKTWVKEFAADPQIVNRTFILNGVPRTLIGIMPPRFAWWGADIWIPDRPSRALDSKEYAGAFPRSWFLLGHLKPGVSKKQAEADLTVVAKRMAAVYPKDYPKHFTLELRSLADGVVGQFQTTIFIVLAAVGLLLLIGCGNVANLLLARATTREKEFAIRAALGASRWRLARQLLVESSILALGGAALGTLVAWGGLKSLVALVPENTIPAEAVIRLNGAVLVFTLSLAAFTALVFGLAPAIKAARKDVNEPLRDSSKGSGGGFRHGKLRNAVVVLEVALSLTLLVSAGLLMRSFIALREVHLGLQPDHVLVARLPLPVERYKTAEQVTSFYRPLLLRLKALPGVVDATETSALPPYGGIPSDIEIPGKTHTEKWNAPFQLCSEGYFSVLKIQFLDGRGFTEAEVAGARRLAVVNQTFVKNYLGGENPIGKQVRIAQLTEFDDPVKEPVFEIIGLVADVKNQGLQDPITPEIWIPYTVTGSAFRGILVRTAGEPLTMLNAVQHEIWTTDNNVALTFTGTLEGYINQFSYAGPRFGFFLMSIFAGVGLVLVTIGVYSVLAYATSCRTQEIGIRMTLGAGSSDVLTMVLRMGLRLVGIGVGLGLIASVALGRVIATQLWGVSAYDPWTLVSVPAVLLLTGLLACWVPARRAASVDPLVALRYE